jgi:SNF2 family DNA or RNA helicase
VEDDRFLESIDDLPVTEQLVQRRERSNSAVQRAAHAEQLVRIEALKQLAARGKIAAATEWITSFIESGEKLIVFAHHQEIQDELLVLFPSAAVVRGGDDVLIRQANVDRFQTDANCRLIVCSLRAGGVGITLTAASNVCFLELGWTPAEHDQAEDRCHRIGQKESVTAWYILADGTLESEIAALIEEKRSVVNAATDGGKRTTDLSIIDELMSRLQT